MRTDSRSIIQTHQKTVELEVAMITLQRMADHRKEDFSAINFYNISNQVPTRVLKITIPDAMRNPNQLLT
jgi:hypothetical protein